MRVVVPYAPDRPKTRLAPALDADERTAFARAMLEDVLAALAALDSSSDRDSSERDADASAADGDRASPDRVADALAVDPVVLSTAPVDVDVPVSVDERSLTAAVNDRLPSRPGDDPVAVVMADLALATPASLARLFVPDADVVLAPGRGGGTNAVVARHPAFRVDYHGASIRDHRRIAREGGLDVATVDSVRLATDVDEPADLVEVVLHGDGAAAAWLADAGFEVRTTDGRVVARRPE